MSRNSPTRCTLVRRLFGPLAAVTVLASGCSLTGASRPPDPVSVDGWSGRSILCGYRGTEDPLADLSAGEVLELRDDQGSALSEGRCRYTSYTSDTSGSNDPGAMVTLEAGQSYFVLKSGVDRFDVTLVSVDTGVEPVALEAEITVAGDDCGQTTEFRGHLMLLIEAPEGATKPTAALRQRPLPC